MSFPLKNDFHIEYLRNLASIASTLASTGVSECQEAASLLGQEAQAIISPPAQKDHPKAGAESLAQAVSYAQDSPGPTLGETGLPLSPIDAAIERVKEARIALNKFPSEAFEAEGYRKAAMRYNEAVDTLEVEIDSSVRGNPDIGTAVSPLDSATEEVTRAHTALSNAESGWHDAVAAYASATSKLNEEIDKATPRK